MAIPLSQFLGAQISNRSRSRGYSYFVGGSVRSLTVENGVVEAGVRGSVLYTVWMQAEGSLLTASCTCPHFIDHLTICKHIWAVILAAEAQSIPLVTLGTAFETVVLEPLITDEDDYAWTPVRPIRRSSPRQRSAPAPWRQLLAATTRSPDPSSAVRPALAHGELLYVVDVASSVVTGDVVIELMTRERKMNGDWSKPKPATLTPADMRLFPDSDERQLFQRLVGPRPHPEWSGGWNNYGPQLSRIQLPGVLGADIVPRLCATGRCVLRPTNNVDIARGPAQRPLPASLLPMAWDDGPPWIFTVGIRTEQDGYAIEAWLARDDRRMALAEPLLILNDGLLFTSTHAARVESGSAFSWLAALHRAGRIVVPVSARDELIESLLTASPRLAEVPDDLKVETIEGRPQPQLTLRPIRSRPDRVYAEVGFNYDGTIVGAESPEPILRSAGSTRAIRRDQALERRMIDLLATRGCRREWSPDAAGPVLQLPTLLVPRVVRQFLEDGWLVEAEGRLYRRPGAAALAVRSGIDWFELHGTVDYGNEQATLPALLAALKRGETFVTLGDGSIGLLPEEWLRRHAALARLGASTGDHLRFTRAQVPLLDALIAAQEQPSWDDAFARARRELQAFEGIAPVDPPPAFAGTLRGYQREGLGWLMFLQRFGFGGCLADDMGLGKTVMVLALLTTRQARPPDERLPSLVVAPRSVVFNWRQEAARFAPDLRVLEYVGGGRASMRASFARHDVILTTYGTLRRDAETLAAERFDYVVLDEAQAIKNAASVSAKATRVLQARHRLALSGTPIENHLGELWSLFEFLNPGLLGASAAFSRSATGERLDDDTLTLIARGLRPFMLRRTKEQVASDLPPKTEQTLYCELERPQRVLYDDLRAHYRRTLLEGTGTNGFGRSKLHVLEALLRLRQAACHPGLIDRRRTNDAAAKLDVLIPRLAETIDEGHKTIVFSQFTSLLAILRTRLDENQVVYEYLDGRTRDRQSKVERFQTDANCRLFLISLKAGGLGLNLTAAEYVFLLDPWWNPAVEAQAIDRAHRIGQSRHVFAYRLIARDTVEERVVELQQRKRRLADAILMGDNSLLRDLKREDLELLLS